VVTVDSNLFCQAECLARRKIRRQGIAGSTGKWALQLWQQKPKPTDVW